MADSEDDDFQLFDGTQPLPDDVNSSDSDGENDPAPAKKRRGKDMQYEEWRTFDSLEAFNAFWEVERASWRLKKKDDLTDASVEYWFCKYGRMVGYSCKVRLRIEFPHDSLEVIVQRVIAQHNHVPDEEATPLTPAVKEFIAEQVANGLAPQRIQVLLAKKGLAAVPTLKQVQNQVHRLRQPSSSPFTDVDFKIYCSDNVQQTGRHDSFVLGWSFTDSENFFVLWTTPHLLDLQKSQELLQCDATNCVNYNGFPLGVYGFSDVDRHFTPTLLSVGPSEDYAHYSSVFNTLLESGYEPTYVLGDGHAGLTKATRETFITAVRLMCYAHVNRRVKKRVSEVPAEFRATILSDLETLRYARSADEFQKLVPMMLDSWPDGAENFKDYFNATWGTGDLHRWYEAASPFVSTNNGLESVNKQIKDAHTLRKRLPFRSFVNTVEGFLHGWSIGATVPPAKPKPTPQLYVDAYSLQRGPEPRIVARLPNRDIYVIPAASSKLRTMDEVKAAYRDFNADPPSWIRFSEQRFKVHVVKKLNPDNAVLYWCSCRDGARKRVCKHSLNIMCTPNVNIYTYPEDATAVPLGNKRKRGRPTQAKVNATVSKYGPIDDLIVLPEKQVAYVVFKTIQGAKACVEFLDGRWKELDGRPIDWTLRRGEWDVLGGQKRFEVIDDKPYCPLRLEYAYVPEQYSHLLKKLPSASKHKALSPVKHPPTPPFDTSKLRANWEQAYEHRRASSAPTQQSSSGSQSSKRRSAPASQRPITAFFAKTAKGEHAERYFEITTAFGEKKRIRDDFYDSD
ncbi:hypothetical protein AAVH_08203 [Aphelenchoides avenae]|nr:hypothetical protein AAVH_08203 [Aphelenchus avenae]